MAPFSPRVYARLPTERPNPRTRHIDRRSALGIAQDSRVVVYDDSSSKDAARVWWILRYWGVADVRLLNGGWAGRNGSPVSTGRW